MLYTLLREDDRLLEVEVRAKRVTDNVLGVFSDQRELLFYPFLFELII